MPPGRVVAVLFFTVITGLMGKLLSPSFQPPSVMLTLAVVPGMAISARLLPYAPAVRKAWYSTSVKVVPMKYSPLPPLRVASHA
ncbi:hypothetical protein D3C81_794920 [compost metagenome]